MTNDLASLTGCLLIFVLCAWAAWHGVTHLRTRIESGKAIDQTLSEVDRHDAPNMYGLQLLGFVLLISTSTLIGIGAFVVFVQRLVSD